MKNVKSFRIDPDLVDLIESASKKYGVSEASLLEACIRLHVDEVVAALVQRGVTMATPDALCAVERSLVEQLGKAKPRKRRGGKSGDGGSVEK